MMMKRSSYLQAGIVAMLILLLLVLVIPILSAFAVAFDSSKDSLKGGFMLFPREFSLEGFVKLFKQVGFLRPFINSTIILVFGTFFHVVTCSLAAYVLAQKNLPGAKIITIFIIATMSVPQQILMMPQYILYKQFSLTNTLSGMIIYNMAAGFSILLMKSYYMGVPKEMAEAAKMDGASNLLIFKKIYLPMVKSGLATIIIIDAVARWNNYSAAVLFITEPKKYTIQQAIKAIVAFDDATSSSNLITPNVQMAGVVIGMLPLVILYFALQKHFAKGLLAGAVKG